LAGVFMLGSHQCRAQTTLDHGDPVADDPGMDSRVEFRVTGQLQSGALT